MFLLWTVLKAPSLTLPPPHTPDWCPADSEAQRITNASCLHATCSPQPHKTLCHYRFLSPGVNWVPHTETVSISCRRTPCSSTIQYIRTLGVRWRVSGGQVQQKSEGSRDRQDRFDQIYLIDLFLPPKKRQTCHRIIWTQLQQTTISKVRVPINSQVNRGQHLSSCWPWLVNKP